MNNGLPRYIFWQMSYLPCHYLGVSVTLLEFPLLLMLPRTINAPEVIFYKPASHSTLQTKFMGFHVHVKRCLNPSDYFFFVEQPFKWLIKSWKKDNYTFSKAKVKTYSFAVAQILKYLLCSHRPYSITIRAVIWIRYVLHIHNSKFLLIHVKRYLFRVKTKMISFHVKVKGVQVLFCFINRSEMPDWITRNAN